MYTGKEYEWYVAEKVGETSNVCSLLLTAREERPSFIAGQYVTVKRADLGPAEGKAYSISSGPEEKHVRITIKEMGTFSKALGALQHGEIVVTSAPYGFFAPETDDSADLVFIAGGIGIAPCISIIKNLYHLKDTRNISLLYSNQTEKDIVFAKELQELSRQHRLLSVTHFITREVPTAHEYLHGRMTPERIFEIVPNMQFSDFFICGSMDFTRDLWKKLRDAGIPHVQLYTEGFF